MKSKITGFFILATMLFIGVNSCAQNPVNWTKKQLIEPADLANEINAKKDLPVVICIGPGATIPNSVNIGMVNNEAGFEKLKKQLETVAKNKMIVIYCGCCPFERCPNVRPAIDILKEMKFTNYYLLNLPHNIKKDWIDKGYPVAKS